MNWTKALASILPAELDPHLKSILLYSITYISVRKGCLDFMIMEKALFVIEKEMGNIEKYEAN